MLPNSTITITDPAIPDNVYQATVLSTWDSSRPSSSFAGLSSLPPASCLGELCDMINFTAGCGDNSWIDNSSTRSADTVNVLVEDTSGNTSAQTDKDNLGGADFDDLDLWDGRIH